MKRSKTLGRAVVWAVVTIVLLAPLFSSFLKYYFFENYDYYIEAECDPSVENCFVRDCSIPDECPPNNFSFFKAFYINAYDFKKCRDNTCSIECKQNVIHCEPINCDSEASDSCSWSQ